MTLAFFTRQMDRMGGLRFKPSDLATHWEALSDIEDTVLEAAVTRAQRTRAEFPTPIELRQDADQVAHRVRESELNELRSIVLAEPVEFTVPYVSKPVRVTHEWRYYCDVCSDSGWQELWCGPAANDPPWIGNGQCERRLEHGSHSWVRQCPCYGTNHAIQSRLERQRKYAAADAGKKHS